MKNTNKFFIFTISYKPFIQFKKYLIKQILCIFVILWSGCAAKTVQNIKETNTPEPKISVDNQNKTSSEKNDQIKHSEKYHDLFFELMTKSDFDIDYTKPKANCHGKVKNHLPQGQWICFSENGKKISTAWLLNGRLNGWVRTWYSNGKIESEAFWKNSSLNGPSVKYYQNGIREITTKFKKNKLYGVTTERDESGHKIWSSFFKNGVQHGRERTFYLNGFMKSRTYYLKGKKSGSYTEWYENGNIKIHGHYSNDRAIGVWTRHENSNNLKSKSGTYEEIVNDNK